MNVERAEANVKSKDTTPIDETPIDDPDRSLQLSKN